MSAITWRPVVLYQRGPQCLELVRRLRLEVSQEERCQTDQRPWREPQVPLERVPQGLQTDLHPWREQLQEQVLAHQRDQNPSQHLLQEEWQLGRRLGLQLQERRLRQASWLQRSWRSVQQQPPQDHPSECARLRQGCL